jgi:hypothetical protein
MVVARFWKHLEKSSMEQRVFLEKSVKRGWICTGNNRKKPEDAIELSRKSHDVQNRISGFFWCHFFWRTFL